MNTSNEDDAEAQKLAEEVALIRLEGTARAIKRLTEVICTAPPNDFSFAMSSTLERVAAWFTHLGNVMGFKGLEFDVSAETLEDRRTVLTIKPRTPEGEVVYAYYLDFVINEELQR